VVVQRALARVATKDGSSSSSGIWAAVSEQAFASLKARVPHLPDEAIWAQVEAVLAQVEAAGAAPGVAAAGAPETAGGSAAGAGAAAASATAGGDAGEPAPAPPPLRYVECLEGVYQGRKGEVVAHQQDGAVLRVRLWGRRGVPEVFVSLKAAKVVVDKAVLARWRGVHELDLRRRELLLEADYNVTPIVPGPGQVISGELGIESPYMPPEKDARVWALLSEGLSNTRADWLGKGRDASGDVRNGLCLGARAGTLGSAASAAAATEPVATEPALCSVVRSRSQRLARRERRPGTKKCHQDENN
jgi:hypothetical protein